MQRSGKLISGYIYNYIAYFRASLDVTPREGAVGPKKSRSCSPSVGLPMGPTPETLEGLEAPSSPPPITCSLSRVAYRACKVVKELSVCGFRPEATTKPELLQARLFVARFDGT